MIKIPLIICLIITMLQSVTASSLHRNKSPAMTESSSEIEMVYYRYFPNAGIHHYRSAGECTLLYKWIKKDRFKIPDVLRCREHIKLLMPTSAINAWKQKQKSTTAETHIISIKPVAVNSQKLLTGKSTNMVTGLFTQHAVNVRRYTFKEIKTGKNRHYQCNHQSPLLCKQQIRLYTNRKSDRLR